MKIEANIQLYKEEIKEHRRALHQIPESGFEEKKTAAYIEKCLIAYGIAVETGVATTGVLGYVEKDPSLPVIAFRSDMDALSMKEETGLDFKSKNEGYMHGCGHDGHMATLLVFAKHIAQNKDRLNANILLIFQPAEEGPGGAEVMVKEGVLSKYGVGEIYGLHLYPEVEDGKLAVRPGAMMAQTGEFDIDITGKSGHGALPHKGIDAIVIAADLISRLQTIVSRQVSPITPAVLTIGKMEGGERRNIIAENVRLEGTIRAFDEQIFDSIFESVKKHCLATEIAHDCKVHWDFRKMYPPVNNDPALTESLVRACEGDIEMIDPQMIAEDFSYFQKAVPGVFFFVGTRSAEKGFVFPLHNARFNFDEETLLNGVQAYVNLLCTRGYLEANA